MALVHHELCFGCGRTNLFGLLLEAERRPDGTVVGRCFIKQDHQGPERGRAHPGLVACALIEAILLAAGESLVVARLELEYGPGAHAVVGEFCDVEAVVQAGPDGPAASAVAAAAGAMVARAEARLAPAGLTAGGPD